MPQKYLSLFEELCKGKEEKKDSRHPLSANWRAPSERGGSFWATAMLAAAVWSAPSSGIMAHLEGVGYGNRAFIAVGERAPSLRHSNRITRYLP